MKNKSKVKLFMVSLTFAVTLLSSCDLLTPKWAVGFTNPLDPKNVNTSEPINPNGIVFVSNRSGNQDIWKMSFDGSNLVALTSFTGRDFNPSVSSDGNRIAWTSDNGGSGTHQIWTMSIDGTEKQQISTNLGNNGQSQPLWSPDDSMILYSSTEAGTYFDWDVWLMDSDGSNKVQLTDTGSTIGWSTGASGWSPDGGRILYGVEEGDSSPPFNIWIMDSDGQNKMKLTTGVNYRSGFARFSPDGTRIFFLSNRSGQWDIWRMDADGNNQTYVYGPVIDVAIDCTHDGRLLFTKNDTAGKMQVWLINQDGTGLTQITDHLSDNFDAVSLHTETTETIITFLSIPEIVAPVFGATPVTTVDTAQYSGTVNWSPAVSGGFAALTTYTATITLTTKPGYTLTGVAADSFTVAGATNITHAADSGLVIAVFPATATDTSVADLISPTIGALKYVPAGSFNNGTSTVTLSAFHMATTEVTQSQYQVVMGSNPSQSSYGIGANNPVNMVNWYDALVFCNKLSILEGRTPVYSINGSTDPAVWGTVPTSSNSTWGAASMNVSANGYRLPTEAEWEYAARGGSPVDNYDYAGSNDINAIAWYYDNSGYFTHLTAGKMANKLGLYDMSGNVWEWCWDWYGNYPSNAQTDPTGVISGTYRILRGGSFAVAAGYCTVSYRDYYWINKYPYEHDGTFGFRVVSRPMTITLIHQDDFTTDTRSHYEIFYNSNNNGIISYFPEELEFTVGGWNGVYIKHKPLTKFPDYVKAVMKQNDFGLRTSYDYGHFNLFVMELGNQAAHSWTQLYQLNGIEILIYGDRVLILIRKSDSSNPDAFGDLILDETIPQSFNSNQWYTLELIRDGVNLSIYIDGLLLKDVVIPERFLTLDMNVGIGGGSYNGYDARISSLEYGNYD
jgi:Tol biopolymer transport system component